MTTELARIDLNAAEVIAEALPGHAQQLATYEAAGLERRDAFMLEAHAARIITIGRQGILQIGQELLAARERAQRGTWSPFLKRAGIEERTAQNYMRVVERFGDKPEIISDFPPTALYAMAAPGADVAVVDAIVEEVQAGGPVPKVEEVKQRLAPAPARPAPPPARPAPTPARATDQEIAAQPTRPAPTPLTITPLNVAAPAPAAPDRKLLVSKRALLAAALDLIEAELAAAPGPTIVVRQDQAESAARMFLVNPALNGAAAMLAFSATVESEAA